MMTASLVLVKCRITGGVPRPPATGSPWFYTGEQLMQRVIWFKVEIICYGVLLDIKSETYTIETHLRCKRYYRNMVKRC